MASDIRESIREYAVALGRWWLLVIADLFFGAIGAYLDVTGDGPIPAWAWLPALLAGLVIAPFIAYNKVRTQRDEAGRKLRELEENRPSIQAAAGFGPLGSMFLEVTNLGEHGDFEAQIEMLEGREFVHGMVRPPLPIYKGYWQTSAGPTARLPQGHKDRLLIGELEVASGIFLAEFKMHFYDARINQAGQYGTTSWVPMKDSGTLAARFVLRITIGSTPRMKEGPFVKTYVVDGGSDPHFREVVDPVSAGQGR